MIVDLVDREPAKLIDRFQNKNIKEWLKFGRKYCLNESHRSVTRLWQGELRGILLAINKENFELSEKQLAEILSEAQISKLKGELPAKTGAWDPEITRFSKRFLQRAKIVRKQVEKDEVVDPVPILSELFYVVKKELVEGLYEFLVCTRIEGDDLIAQSTRVTFTSLVIGRGLGYDSSMLVKLGLAAFLQDLGMYKVPRDILQKGNDLRQEEIDTIKEHPKESFRILSKLGKKYEWLAEIALQVHERANGMGYPNGLKENDIYEISFVIGIADMYVALISDRPYRNKLIQTDAIKSAIEDYGELFPMRVRRALLDQVSLFPVNTYVKLNTKALGRVVRVAKEQSLRPTIEVYYDKFGNKLKEPEIVDLSLPENHMCYIVRGLSKTDLPRQVPVSPGSGKKAG